MKGYRIYQPALLEQHVRALYRLKEQTGLPMTYHARLAVEEYVERWGEPGGANEGSVTRDHPKD